MPKIYELNIEGQQLVALAGNEDLSGPPVIFLHGIMASVNFWVPDKLPQFCRNLPYYALTLPGHYPAAFPSGFQAHDLTAEGIADLLGTAIRHLVGDQPVVLMGHSTGGFAALAIAAYQTAAVRAVISISGFAQGRWGGSLAGLQRLARLGPAGAALFRANLGLIQTSLALYRTAMQSYTADSKAFFAFAGIDQILRTTYADFQHLDLDAMRLYFERMPDIDISPVLPRIEVPVLALAGDRDPIVPPTQACLIAHNVAQGEVVLLHGSGHIPTAERAAAFNDAVNGWALAVLAEQLELV